MLLAGAGSRRAEACPLKCGVLMVEAGVVIAGIGIAEEVEVEVGDVEVQL